MNEREDLASSVPPTVCCSALRCARYFGHKDYDQRRKDFLGRYEDTSYAGDLKTLYEEFEGMARSAHAEGSAVPPLTDPSIEVSTPAVPYQFAQRQRSPASRLIAACSHA